MLYSVLVSNSLLQFIIHSLWIRQSQFTQFYTVNVSVLKTIIYFIDIKLLAGNGGYNPNTQEAKEVGLQQV